MEINNENNKRDTQLQEHGGFCDCEVIYNVYDAVTDLVGWYLETET
ncbi:DUF2695 domain-containing protein [Deefgea salmonis]|uniref:DUF2695 domain-containing protein n=1 Tax=Deefgea salmonis TaxID=2875502 RepID=A0ABS8BM28_9NEIS|nr:DUF2695 domain-containing protein [Deefgea salmonis]